MLSIIFYLALTIGIVCGQSWDPESWSPSSTTAEPTAIVTASAPQPAIPATTPEPRIQQKYYVGYGSAIYYGSSTCDCRDSYNSCYYPLTSVPYSSFAYYSTCGYSSTGCCRSGYPSTTTWSSSECICTSSSFGCGMSMTTAYSFASAQCLNFEVGCCRSTSSYDWYDYYNYYGTSSYAYYNYYGTTSSLSSSTAILGSASSTVSTTNAAGFAGTNGNGGQSGNSSSSSNLPLIAGAAAGGLIVVGLASFGIYKLVHRVPGPQAQVVPHQAQERVALDPVHQDMNTDGRGTSGLYNR